MRRLFTPLFAIVAAFLVSTSIAQGAADVGKEAPAFSLTDTAGKVHQLSDYKGKIVVIHFQAVKCPWDIAYQPHLNKVAKSYEGQPVVFIGINSNKTEPMDMLKADVTKKGIPYNVVKDPGNKIADEYGASTTPHIYIVDAQGILRYKGGVETPVGSPSDVTKGKDQYLTLAVDALLKGETPPHTSTRSIGCSIKR